jgi:hypothetical protein
MCWRGVFALTVLMVSPAWAQLEGGRTLYGLDEVGVVVENVHPDLERQGLSGATLQTEVILRLQQAGIHVLAEDEWEETLGRPLLYLYVGIVPLDNFPVYSVIVTLQLRQSVCLARNLIICETAITWEDAGVMRIVSVSRLASLPQEVRNVVDRFTTAYLAENRKR